MTVQSALLGSRLRSLTQRWRSMAEALKSPGALMLLMSDHLALHTLAPGPLSRHPRCDELFPELRNQFGQTTLVYKRANYNRIMPSPIRFAWSTQRQPLLIVLEIKSNPSSSSSSSLGLHCHRLRISPLMPQQLPALHTFIPALIYKSTCTYGLLA